MKLIDREWNAYLEKYENTWLADNESEITADFDSECAESSIIMVISSGAIYIKNNDCKWQKFGSNEVIG